MPNHSKASQPESQVSHEISSLHTHDGGWWTGLKCLRQKGVHETVVG